MTQSPLPDRWHSRDLPVLIGFARRIDAGDSQVNARTIAEDLGMDPADVDQAYGALVDAKYLEIKHPHVMGGGPELEGALGWFSWTALTERGLRTVGLWPSGEGVDALVDALRQAEDATTDPDERSALRRAWSSLGGVSRDVMVDVLGAVIARQSGIG